MATGLRVGLAAVLVAVLVASPCAAQPTSEREATAEDLFQRGKERMEAKDTAKACALFAESYRIDAAGGTLQNLAICYEELGRWASAYARFEELRGLSKKATPPRADRIALADEHIAVLRPRVSRLFVVIPPAHRVPGMAVKVDGVLYEDVAREMGIVVDPGPHEVVVSATAMVPFVARIEVAGQREATRAEVIVPSLSPAPRPPLAALPAPGHPTRTLGGVIGGVGVAALAAGGVFGVLAIGASSSGKERCERGSNPSAPSADFDPVTGRCLEGSAALMDANEEKDRSRTLGNVANVLVPVGIAALAVGAYLFLRESPGRDPGRAGLMPGRHGTSFELRF